MTEPSGRYVIVGQWLAQETDGCTCGSPNNAPYPHEPGCGQEPIQKIETLLAADASVARVRSLRDSLQPEDTVQTDWLRHQLNIALGEVELPPGVLPEAMMAPFDD